jgi:hypothetical protein
MKNYNTLRCWLCWLVGALAVSFMGLQASVDGAPATESSPDLLDDLGGDLFGPSKAAEIPGADPKLLQPAPPAGEDLGRPSEDSPLASIVSNMKQAGQLIAQQTLTGQTAQIQESVLSSLDELIKQSEQQNQNNSQSQQQQSQQQQQQASQRSTPKPSPANQQAGQQRPGTANAARTSSERLESGAADEAAGQGSRELLKDVWGQLPERVRQQLLQSSTDEFLPQYRDEIERYFKRLAEEEAGDNGQAP